MSRSNRQKSQSSRSGNSNGRKDLNTLDQELQDFTSNQPLLYSWLLKRGYYGSRSNPSNSTHLLMDGHGGGIVNVPEKALSTMYDVFALDIEKGYEIPLIEKRTEWFAWHADADIKGPRRLREEEILNYCITIQESIKKFFPETDGQVNSLKTFDMIILLVKPTKHRMKQMAKEKENAQNDSIKTGIHIVMPYLHVNASQCLAIRMTIIGDLYNKYREWPGFNSISDQIDRSVYVSNGLRVPGSAKFEKCPRCNNDKNDKINCPRCLGKGRCSVGRQYFPHKYLNSDNSLNEVQLEYLQENIARMISKCVVGRKDSSSKHALFKEPFGAPVDPKEQDASVLLDNSNRKRSRSTGRTKLCDDEIGIKKFSRTKKLIENADVLKKVEEIIRRAATVEFKDRLNGKPIGLRLDRVYSIPTDKCYRATVRGDCENWCSNLISGEKHRGNRHYWEIRTHGLQQRCFSQSETYDRRIGTTFCKDFYGRIHGITEDEMHLLFPEHSTVNLMLQFKGDSGMPLRSCSSKTERDDHLHFLKVETWGEIVNVSKKIYGNNDEDKFDPTSKRRKIRK